MGHYPIFLDLNGRSCLVVGGGAVAERKVAGLLQVGARVTVVSPGLTTQLSEWTRQGTIRHIGREYRLGDVAGHDLAFGATDDPAANGALSKEAKEQGVWVNAADDPAHCDFILPSVLRRGELVVAVATGGSSPALSRAIKEELETHFTDDYAELARIAAEVRQELKRRSVAPGAEAWRQALNGRLRELIREGHLEEAKSYLLARLGERA